MLCLRKYSIFLVPFLFALGMTTLAWPALERPTAAMQMPPGVGSSAHYLRRGMEISVVDTLISEADHIVRAEVIRADSRAERDGMIVTDVEFAPLYSLRGEITAPFTITVIGGVNQATGIGLISSRTVAFDLHEHVVLFLRERGAGLALLRDGAGKFQVADQQVQSPLLGMSWSMEDFYARLQRHASTSGVSLPADWSQRESDAAHTMPVRAASFVYDGLRWEGDHPMVPFAVNLNSGRIDGGEGGDADNFRDAIITAADTWSDVETAAFTFEYAGETEDTEIKYNGTNAIYFSPDLEDGILGITLYWYNVTTGYIVEADTAFNDRVNFDATGTPDGSEIDLGSVALHELGHWLSLGHDTQTGAVMYATLRTGETARTLHTNDRDGISFVYPCTDATCEEATPAPTATPNPQATPVVTPGVDPTTTPSGDSPTTDTVRVYPDDETEVTFESPDGLTLHVTMPAGSVAQETHISFGPPTRIPDLNGYAYIGFGFQLRASVAGTQIPEFALDLPATLTTEFGQMVGQAASDSEFALLRFNETTQEWVNAECTTDGQDNAGAQFDVCVLGEFAIATPIEPTDDGSNVFLPLMRRPSTQ